jgi:hypothetical protein
MTSTVKRRFPDLSGPDIMAVAFLVLMEAAQSAREDLKSLIEKAKREAERKRQLAFHGMATEPAWPPQGIRTAAVSSCVAAPAASRTTEPAGEMQQRLQMYTDALSHQMAMISNPLKKTSDSSLTIVHSLK